MDSALAVMLRRLVAARLILLFGNADDKSDVRKLMAGELPADDADRAPRVAEMSRSGLMAAQARARRQQAASLEAYFAKTGKPERVNGEWPVHALPDGLPDG